MSMKSNTYILPNKLSAIYNLPQRKQKHCISSILNRKTEKNIDTETYMKQIILKKQNKNKTFFHYEVLRNRE